MIHRHHGRILGAADGYKGQLAAFQQRDQRVAFQRAGQNQAVDLAVVQKALHRACLVLAYQGQQHIVIAILRRLIDRTHRLAQKRHLKIRELLGDHQRNVVRAAHRQPACHHAGGVVMYALTGCCAHTAIAGYCPGYRCF